MLMIHQLCLHLANFYLAQLDPHSVYIPPSDLVEVNEQLMDAKVEGDEKLSQSIIENIAKLKFELYASIKSIVEHYQEGISTEEELLQVKEYYFKKKYLDRMEAQG